MNENQAERKRRDRESALKDFHSPMQEGNSGRMGEPSPDERDESIENFRMRRRNDTRNIDRMPEDSGMSKDTYFHDKFKVT